MISIADRPFMPSTVPPFLSVSLRLFGLFVLCLSALSACGISGYGARQYDDAVPVYHQVKTGDTLWSIGKHYGVSPQTLMLLNGVGDPNGLPIGRRLLVRYGGTEGRAPTLRTFAAARPPVSGGRLQWPVSGGRLVSRFGPRSASFHDGLDIAAPSGTPVYAAHTGTILYAGSGIGGYGKLIIMRGDDRLITVYAHNSRLLAAVGDRVNRGAIIAEVGSTGRSSGPHLHFEVRTKDSRNRTVAVDPWPLLNAGKSPAPRYRVNESLSPLLVRSSR